jgi:hypothetical protein
MRVVFHIISTGGGGGASRATRYISERDKDPTREGPGARPLFSEDREALTYRKADGILDPMTGQPDKDDLLHVTVSIEESEFDKLGDDEKEKQKRFREVIRDGMKGMVRELNVEKLTWVAGIHRNSDNPHAHIVMRNSAITRGGVKETDIGRLRKSLLPHKQMQDGRETIVPGRIGEKFLEALDKQQALHLNPDSERVKAQQAMEQLIDRVGGSNREPVRSDGAALSPLSGRSQKDVRRSQPEHHAIVASWNQESIAPAYGDVDYRIALGRHLEFTTRLQFAEVWRERAVKNGDTYRFNVVDQTTSEARRISELDVHRRAAARAQRVSPLNREIREQAYEADLSNHRATLDQLTEAREAKVAALGKDVGSLRGTVSKVENHLARFYETRAEKQLTPLISRSTLSELQNQAVKLNLPERVAELEHLRIQLAGEHDAPSRTDEEASTLAAEVKVACADLMARNARLDKFEASVHLTPYEVHGERWSLAGIDKQISRRREDAKVVPDRAARLDLRSLARMNFSPAARHEASAEVEHLSFIRGEIVRQIEQRRRPLIVDRELSTEMLEILEKAYASEQQTRRKNGQEMQEPKYEAHQMRALEASVEILKDAHLLREVHDWEKNTSRTGTASWEGRAVAREIMAGIAVEEAKERLQHFLESKRVASLSLGHYRTATLREIEARTLTDYLARAIESQGQRDYRRSVKSAAHETHSRFIKDFDKAMDYHEATRELATEAQGREAKFTNKEKINLEIYAERQNDETIRDQILELARGDAVSDREMAVSRER